MKTTREMLGLRIKELRKARGMSQDALSEKVGIDPKHLSRIEVGGSYPSMDTLERIAGSLGVEIKDFFEFGHLETRVALRESIHKMLKEASTDDLKVLHKIIRAIVR